MTLNGINEWLSDKTLVTIESAIKIHDGGYESSHESRIYKDKNEKFYRLEFMDGTPKRNWFANSTHEVYFKPIEVVRKTKVVEYFEVIR